MRAILLALAILLAPTAVEAEDRRSLHWGIACSITADAADLVSTFYAFDRRPDAVEGNLLFGDTKDRTRFLVIKAIGAATVNGIAIWLHDDGKPVWSQLLVWGNCVLKTAFTLNNIRLARSSPAIGLSLRW